MSKYTSTCVRFWLVILNGVALLAFGWPQTVLAGDCDNVLDIGKSAACELDVAQYGFYESIASIIWVFDRVLLGGAHWLDALRFQFVQIVFTGVYAELTEAIGPLLGPAAVLALAAGALLLIAMPLTGSTGPVNFRMIFMWAIIGPLLLTLSGPYFVEFEQLRTDIGTTLFQSTVGSSFTLAGGAANDMLVPTNLYPSAACGLDSNGQPLLQRYTENAQPGVDEQAAALVWATAQDIHCPNTGDGASATFPDRFFVDAPQGPGYFAAGGIENRSRNERARYLQSQKEAINRLLLAVLPSFVAFLISLLNFIFACCAMILWFSLPIGLLFSFFNTNAGWFTELVKRAAGILKTSWLISILLGVFSSILLEASAAGDALRYAILAIISGIFVARFAYISFGLFNDALATMAATSGFGSRTLTSSPGRAELSIKATTGTGATTAFTGATVFQQPSSGSHTPGGARHLKPLMQLGEVAASMGGLRSAGTDEFYSLVHPEQVSAEGAHSAAPTDVQPIPARRRLRPRLH